MYRSISKEHESLLVRLGYDGVIGETQFEWRGEAYLRFWIFVKNRGYGINDKVIVMIMNHG